MGSQRRTTREWNSWYEFHDDGNITCVFCNTTFTYNRIRAFMHLGYMPKSEKSVCSLVPHRVRSRFANCGGIVPARMSDEDMYGGDSTTDGPSKGIPCGSSCHVVVDTNTGVGVRGGSPHRGGRDACVVEGRDNPHSMSAVRGA